MTGTAPAIPEFELGTGTRQSGNTVSLFADNIFLIGAGKNNDIYQTLYPMASGLAAPMLSNKSLWQSSQIQLQNQFKPQTTGLCASVGLGLGGSASSLYLAWAQPNAGILAAPCTGVQPPSGDGTSAVPVWGDAFLLRDQTGAVPTLRSGGCDVCGTPLGSTALLIAYPVTDSGQAAVFVGLYYLADQAAGTTVTTEAGSFTSWNARASVVVTLSFMASLPGNAPGTDLYDTGSTVSIVTVPFVAPDGSGSDNQLSLVVVAFLTVEMDKYESGDSGPKTNKFWWPMQLMLPLDATGAPLLSGTPAPQAIWTAGTRPKSNLTAVCDPAGRIVSCGASEDWPTENLPILTFGVFQTYTLPPSLAPDGIMTQAPSAAATQPPALLFLIGAGTPGSSVTNVTGNGDMLTTTYPVSLLACYGESTVAQLVDYGSIEVTSNYALGDLLVADGSGGTTLSLGVHGIIDGPIPVPNQNIAGWQFENTVNDLGSITYGNQVGQGTQTTQSYNWNVGFQSSGNIAFTFFSEADGEGGKTGMAWQASVSGGMTESWGNSNTSTLQSALQQTSIANVNSEGMPPYTAQIGTGVDPTASFWAGEAGVSFTNFRFLDAAGLVISDGSQGVDSYTPLAPVQGTSSGVLGPGTMGQYIPYMVTPGDLLSYTIDGVRTDGTPCGIDATMKGLAGIDNYFETIIWPGAFTFMDGTGNAAKYLLFNWSISGVSGQGFTNVQGTSRASGWQINASLYAGVTWGISAGVPFLFGTETQGTLLVGGSGGYSTTTTTTTTNQWGISIAPAPGASPPFGPPNWGTEPSNVNPALQPAWEGAVAEYDFALFLLPDPDATAPAPLTPGYWTSELIKYGNTNGATANPPRVLPTAIDNTIGCWKIVYVVLSMWTNADVIKGTPTYCYTDPNGWFGIPFCMPSASRERGAKGGAPAPRPLRPRQGGPRSSRRSAAP